MCTDMTEKQSATLPVGVVTTASRAGYLSRTLSSLNDSYIHVFNDLEQGLVRNHLAAWDELFDTDPSATHALLLQDDVIATQQWRAAVTQFATALADAPAISFYSPRKAVTTTTALARGVTSIPGRTWLNEQALLLRRDVCMDYLDYVSSDEYRQYTNFETAWKHHDMLLQGFFGARSHRVYLCAPPIVQHVGTESTVGNPWRAFGRPRQAPNFPGEDFAAADHFRRVLDQAAM